MDMLLVCNSCHERFAVKNSRVALVYGGKSAIVRRSAHWINCPHCSKPYQGGDELRLAEELDDTSATAINIGTGAIAQGGSVAAGKGGIAVGGTTRTCPRCGTVNRATAQTCRKCWAKFDD